MRKKERKRVERNYHIVSVVVFITYVLFHYRISILQMGKRAHKVKKVHYTLEPRNDEEKHILRLLKFKYWCLCTNLCAFVWMAGWLCVCVHVHWRLCQRHWNALTADETHFRTFFVPLSNWCKIYIFIYFVYTVHCTHTHTHCLWYLFKQWTSANYRENRMYMNFACWCWCWCVNECEWLSLSLGV